MSLMQLTAMFAGLAILLGIIAFALVRQAPPNTSRKSKTGPEEAPIVEKASQMSDISPAPQARKRRLVTDLPIKHDPLAPQGDSAPRARAFAEVEGRLEAAFDELQLGKMSLDTYRSIIQGEEALVRSDIARLSTAEAGESQALREAQRAMDLIRYCLEWRPAQ